MLTIFKKDKDRAGSLFERAVEQHQRGNLSKAEALYRQILQDRPADAEALHLLGVLTAQKGNGLEGLDLIRQAIALKPDSPAYFSNLGKMLFSLTRVDESISAYREALRLGPDNADTQYNLGIALLQKGNIDDGARCLQEAARLNPNVAELRLQLGSALFRLNRLDEAVESFRAAVQLRADYSEAHNNLGVALRALGRSEEAAQCFHRAVHLNPGGAEARVNLGGLYAQQGSFKDAAQQYQSAVLLEPDNANALIALAEALAADGRLNEAVDSYREAVRHTPDHAEAYCNLGVALQKLGSLEEAETALRRAVELAPGNGDFAANLRTIGSGGVPMWHFSMLNDAERNSTYEKAITSAVRSGDHVLEIGTGSGLLSMMAARAGAGRVTTCEMVRLIAAKARQIIDKNGYRDQITVIGKISSGLSIPEDMPDRADLLMAEIVSSDLLGENMLETYEDAKDRLLKPDARIIPSTASIVGQLAGADGLDRYVKVESVAGFDLRDFNAFMPIKVHPTDVDLEFEHYSEPFDIFEFDFKARRRSPSERKRLSATVTRTGVCRGVLQWIRLQLFENVRFENSPHRAAGLGRTGHWQQILHTFSEPVHVEKGQIVQLVAAHNRRNLMFYVDAVE